MNYAYLHPRDEIALTLSRIYRYKMTTTSGGNLSLLDENGDMWITPSRVDKGTLTAADIVCVKKDGTVAGAHIPSSEFPFHRAIYEARPDIRAVVHTHPMAHQALYDAHPEVQAIINACPLNALAFSVCHKAIDTRTFPECYFFLREVGLLPFEMTFNNYAAMIRQLSLRHPAAVLCNNGVMVLGHEILSTFDQLEVLECSAAASLDSLPIGGHVPMGGTGDRRHHQSVQPARIRGRR
jgi:L-fuculose-phosphate aldolase